ncbi:MAG TPA: hypothetical protein PKW15_04935 [Alphaproteobacteria bacterium]|nr:hypothetical protein [Alphaproteobacteria bacterium]
MTINLLPVDGNGNPVDILRLRSGGAQQVAFTSTSARQSAAFSADRIAISIYATKDCFIKTGDNTVAAAVTDHFLPAGFYTTLALKGHTHIAVIRSAENGTLYISELD